MPTKGSIPKRRMVPLMRISFVLALLVAVVVVLPATTAALPYMMLTTTRPKCVGVIAAQGQTITIGYDMPGKFSHFCDMVLEKKLCLG